MIAIVPFSFNFPSCQKRKLYAVCVNIFFYLKLSCQGNWSASGPTGPAAPSRGQRFPPPIPSSNQSSSSGSGNDVQMLMDQVRQLQQKVTELSKFNPDGGLASSQDSSFEAEQPQFVNILLVSNLPPSLATCDALFFMFDRFV